jgi:hypothetical protein
VTEPNDRQFEAGLARMVQGSEENEKKSILVRLKEIKRNIYFLFDDSEEFEREFNRFAVQAGDSLTESQAAAQNRRLDEALKLERIRRTYAHRIFWLTLGWLSFVLLILGASGSDIQLLGLKKFHLDTAVLIAFITTSSLQVLGLMIIVAKWLFPQEFAQAARSGSAASPSHKNE